MAYNGTLYKVGEKFTTSWRQAAIWGEHEQRDVWVQVNSGWRLFAKLGKREWIVM